MSQIPVAECEEYQEAHELGYFFTNAGGVRFSSETPEGAPGSAQAVVVAQKFGITAFTDQNGVFIARTNDLYAQASKAHKLEPTDPASVGGVQLPLPGVTALALSGDQLLLACVAGSSVSIYSLPQLLSRSAGSPQSLHTQEFEQPLLQFAWCPGQSAGALPTYLVLQSGSRELLLGSLGGGTPDVVTTGIEGFAWSPDGSHFAYSCGPQLIIKSPRWKVDSFVAMELEPPSMASEDQLIVDSLHWTAPCAMVVGATQLDSDGREATDNFAIAVTWDSWSGQEQDVPSNLQAKLLSLCEVDLEDEPPGCGEREWPYLYCTPVTAWGLNIFTHRKIYDEYVRLALVGSGPDAVVLLEQTETALVPDVPLLPGSKSNFAIGMALDYSRMEPLDHPMDMNKPDVPASATLLLATIDGALRLYRLANFRKPEGLARAAEPLPAETPAWALEALAGAARSPPLEEESSETSVSSPAPVPALHGQGPAAAAAAAATARAEKAAAAAAAAAAAQKEAAGMQQQQVQQRHAPVPMAQPEEQAAAVALPSDDDDLESDGGEDRRQQEGGEDDAGSAVSSASWGTDSGGEEVDQPQAPRAASPAKASSPGKRRQHAVSIRHKKAAHPTAKAGGHALVPAFTSTSGAATASAFAPPPASATAAAASQPLFNFAQAGTSAAVTAPAQGSLFGSAAATAPAFGASSASTAFEGTNLFSTAFAPQSQPAFGLAFPGAGSAAAPALALAPPTVVPVGGLERSGSISGPKAAGVPVKAPAAGAFALPFDAFQRAEAITKAPAEDFQPSQQFQGARAGFTFTTGKYGTGYYRDQPPVPNTTDGPAPAAARPQPAPIKPTASRPQPAPSSSAAGSAARRPPAGGRPASAAPRRPAAPAPEPLRQGVPPAPELPDVEAPKPQLSGGDKQAADIEAGFLRSLLEVRRLSAHMGLLSQQLQAPDSHCGMAVFKAVERQTQQLRQHSMELAVKHRRQAHAVGEELEGYDDLRRRQQALELFHKDASDKQGSARLATHLPLEPALANIVTGVRKRFDAIDENMEVLEQQLDRWDAVAASPAAARGGKGAPPRSPFRVPSSGAFSAQAAAANGGARGSKGSGRASGAAAAVTAGAAARGAPSVSVMVLETVAAAGDTATNLCARVDGLVKHLERLGIMKSDPEAEGGRTMERWSAVDDYGEVEEATPAALMRTSSARRSAGHARPATSAFSGGTGAASGGKGLEWHTPASSARRGPPGTPHSVSTSGRFGVSSGGRAGSVTSGDHGGGASSGSAWREAAKQLSGGRVRTTSATPLPARASPARPASPIQISAASSAAAAPSGAHGGSQRPPGSPAFTFDTASKAWGAAPGGVSPADAGGFGGVGTSTPEGRRSRAVQALNFTPAAASPLTPSTPASQPSTTPPAAAKQPYGFTFAATNNPLYDTSPASALKLAGASAAPAGQPFSFPAAQAAQPPAAAAAGTGQPSRQSSQGGASSRLSVGSTASEAAAKGPQWPFSSGQAPQQQQQQQQQQQEQEEQKPEPSHKRPASQQAMEQAIQSAFAAQQSMPAFAQRNKDAAQSELEPTSSSASVTSTGSSPQPRGATAAAAQASKRATAGSTATAPAQASTAPPAKAPQAKKAASSQPPMPTAEEMAQIMANQKARAQKLAKEKAEAAAKALPAASTPAVSAPAAAPAPAAASAAAPAAASGGAFSFSMAPSTSAAPAPAPPAPATSAPATKADDLSSLMSGSGFGFGASSSAAPPASPKAAASSAFEPSVFSLQISDAGPSPPAFGLPTSAAPAAAPAFGTPPKQSTPASVFGMPAASAPSSPPASAAVPAFGSVPQTPPQTPPAASSPFGTPASAFSAPGTPAFGITPAFGSSTPAFGTPASPFGAAVAGAAPSTAAAFGTPALGTPAPLGSSAGSAGAPATSAWGSAPASPAASTPQSVFGAQPQQQALGVFGQPSAFGGAAAAAPASPFGTSSAFGQPASPAAAFGQAPAFGAAPVAQPAQGFGVFGAPAAPAAPFGAAFGASAAPAAPFGQAFGGGAAATGNAFASFAAPAGGGFGAFATQGGGGFGAIAGGSPGGQQGGFGAAAAAGSGFGGGGGFGAPAAGGFGAPAAAGFGAQAPQPPPSSGGSSGLWSMRK